MEDTLPPEAPDAPHTGSDKVVVDPPREPRKPQLDVVDPGKPDKSDDKTTDADFFMAIVLSRVLLVEAHRASQGLPDRVSLLHPEA